MQRGFIGGRSLLANAVDIDYEMQSTVLTAEQGGSFFFDFRAAFPSNTTDFNVFTPLSLLSAASEIVGVYTPSRTILPWKMMILFTNDREFLPRICLSTLSSNASTQEKTLPRIILQITCYSRYTISVF